MRIRSFAAALAAAGLAASTALLSTPASAAPAPEPVASAGSITATLNRDAAIPGTAWVTDAKTGKVVVSYDETVSGTKLNSLQSVTRQYGDQVVMTKLPGKLTKYISGGDAIYTGGARCSLGFNVRDGAGTNYFITAGHCTNIGASWTGNGGAFLGNRVGTSFPGNDYGIVQYDPSFTGYAGDVNLYNGTFQDITGAADAFVGQSVLRSGSTTGLRGGSVTGVNATVNYAEGSVFGMIQTNVCAEPGDSGGSLFSGSTALGLTSGGSGNCRSGGVTFYQPVPEVLATYGVNVW